MTPGPERTSLASADISSCAGYLAGVELGRAQDILSDRTVIVVEAMAPFQPLTVEGGAAFMYLAGERSRWCSMLWRDSPRSWQPRRPMRRTCRPVGSAI